MLSLTKFVALRINDVVDFRAHEYSSDWHIGRRKCLNMRLEQ